MSTIQESKVREYLTTGEAAARARTTRTTIRRWIEAGKLTASRPGRRLLVDARSLQVALAPVGKREVE
jgi:excisionase family DNA binding protein